MQEKGLFNKYQEGRHWENHPTIYAERYADFLREQNFSDLLVDVGCGNGRDVAFFQNNSFNVMGVDYSPVEITNAKLKYPTCQFEVQNVEKLRFEDNSVGAYFMINVIHYVQKQKALDELLRTLKTGRYAFIHFNIDIIDNDGNVDYHHDEKDINRLISKFKLQQQRIFERVDTIPKKHTHRILEVILQK